MTYASDEFEELRGQRLGVCHRCGWTGTVGEVHGSDRKSLRTGHRFGRLCQECVTDIRRAQPVLRFAYSMAAMKAVRIRKVA
jgi:hypothetical protein